MPECATTPQRGRERLPLPQENCPSKDQRERPRGPTRSRGTLVFLMLVALLVVLVLRCCCVGLVGRLALWELVR